MDYTAKFMEILKPEMARQMAQAQALRLRGEPQEAAPEGGVDLEIGMPVELSRTSEDEAMAADDLQARAMAAMLRELRRRESGNVNVHMGMPEIVRR